MTTNPDPWITNLRADGPGWCLARLGAMPAATLLVMRDAAVTVPGEVFRLGAPEAVWLLAELLLVTFATSPAECLRDAHRIKKQFPGSTVVAVGPGSEVRCERI